MAMIIKNNMSAIGTLNTLNKNAASLAKDLKKVSTGTKITSAADDASGYAISERMRVQMRGLDQDNANAQNATSLLKTADGAIRSSLDLLKTMKEKAINAANDTNTDVDRATIQKELDQSIDQLDDNANVTFNGKRLFDGAADTGHDVKQTIVKGLNSEWIESSLQLVKDTYGISFQDDTATPKEMTLKFVNTGGNDLASVSWGYDSEGHAHNLTLNVNMDYYKDLNQTDPDGSSAATAAVLDRTLAHEFTHAVMAANIQHMEKLPDYIVEGSAEYTHGIDDQRVKALKDLTVDTIDNAPAGTEKPYAVGYAFLHYLNKKSGHDGGAMKRLMSELVAKGGDQAGLDAAIAAASKGGFMTEAAAKTAFKADFQATLDAGGKAEDFLKNYCDIDMTDKSDTGSATGAKSWNGEKANNSDVVLEGKSTRYWWYPSAQKTTIDGLTMDWGSYPAPDLTNAGFRFQIGTKANQNILAAFSDIHANALGVRSDAGENVSVATRANAKRAMTIFDRSIRKALDQATTIGALASRMEYTQSNLRAASENVQASESTIRDADMAKEMTDYTRDNVLMQAAQSMLAQANQSSSGVLSLLQ